MPPTSETSHAPDPTSVLVIGAADAALAIHQRFEGLATVRFARTPEEGLALARKERPSLVIVHTPDQTVLAGFLELGATCLAPTTGDIATALTDLVPHLASSCSHDTQSVIDIDSLLAWLPDQNDYRAAIAVMLARLAEDGPAMIAEMRRAWRPGETGLLRHLLHKARGGVGSLGARRFAEMTIEVEVALREGKHENVEAGLFRLEEEMAAIVPAIGHWLARESRIQERVRGTDMPCERLQAMAARHDLAACDLYRSLRRELEATLRPSELARLDRAIHTLDFPGFTSLWASARAGLAREDRASSAHPAVGNSSIRVV
ncbi:Hpt domain-containing protein [Paludibacterium paludis]|uniref:HPt domain-containing protein n=1 Tax=Paludibacterium paludis TaxID=1225769 RepID=A0A918U9H0_9NEIS|nr:Hpt domain-containing protein [Paludibacterium paludis]GGY13296.1 hypothetical protein GCM10011289_15730 [Paludibacterium paludis]